MQINYLMEMKFWVFYDKRRPNSTYGSIWRYVHSTHSNLQQFLSNHICNSWSTTNRTRSPISLTYLKLQEQIQMSTTEILKKTKCERMTCLRRITFKKPTMRRTRIRKESFLPRPRYCILLQIKLSCTIR